MRRDIRRGRMTSEGWDGGYSYVKEKGRRNCVIHLGSDYDMSFKLYFLLSIILVYQ